MQKEDAREEGGEEGRWYERTNKLTDLLYSFSARDNFMKNR